MLPMVLSGIGGGGGGIYLALRGEEVLMPETNVFFVFSPPRLSVRKQARVREPENERNVFTVNQIQRSQVPLSRVAKLSGNGMARVASIGGAGAQKVNKINHVDGPERLFEPFLNLPHMATLHLCGSRFKFVPPQLESGSQVCL